VNADSALALIEDVGIVPSVRVASSDDARFAVEALYAAGMAIVEVTMTTPQAIDVIGAISKSMPDVLVGAGTVLDSTTARRCIDAGAQFITSPGFARDVVELMLKKRVLVIPGAVTPTDVMNARGAGTFVVKIFPAAQFGGPALVRALKASFPEMRFVAAGGISQHTAPDFIRAGAMAIGVGRELIPRDAVLRRDRDWIAELVHRFRHLIADARAESPHAASS
jgi:2-dehydro-3-deoxyphosphogluconate aldolase/(4S)-4-hydroxy-2-oxoglutarate aldolase